MARSQQTALAKERVNRGWTRSDVLRACCGLYGSDYSKIESGSMPAWPRARAMISQALGWPESALFGEGGWALPTES